MQEYRTLNFFLKGIDSLPWVRSAFSNVLNLHRPLLLTRRIYVAISFYYRYRIEIQIGKHLALKKVNDPIERMRLDDYWKFCFRHNFSAWRNNRWLLVNYFTITSREKGDLVWSPKDLQIYLYITIDLLVSSPDLSESFNLNITTFRVAFQCTKQEERATLCLKHRGPLIVRASILLFSSWGCFPAVSSVSLTRSLVQRSLHLVGTPCSVLDTSLKLDAGRGEKSVKQIHCWSF